MINNDKLLKGLIRVEAHDGSVWWTLPAYVESYRSIITAIISGRSDNGDYDHIYYGGQKKRKKNNG